MTDLDQPETFQRLDPAGMGGLIAGLPEQVRDAWESASALRLPDEWREPPRQVLILGMGGSAIGGDMLRALVALESPVPVRVIRAYDVPPGLDERSLVVGSSYSGETEETLSAFEQALPTPARKFVSTGGGRLLELARRHGIPHYAYHFPAQPRAALGHGLMPLVRLAEHCRLLSRAAPAVEEAVRVMGELRSRIGIEVREAENEAKQMARRMAGRLPVVIGSWHLAEAAHRWKTQLNENAKSWAAYDELPEADHNAIVGFGLPGEVATRIHVVFLHHASLHPRVRRRYLLTQEALTEAGVSWEVMAAEGETPLAQALSAVLYGDYVSYYLALLNGVDPTPVTPIDRLKRRLAESG